MWCIAYTKSKIQSLVLSSEIEAIEYPIVSQNPSKDGRNDDVTL